MPTVAVIGSGFAGIAAAVAFTKSGVDDFTIFERSSGIGGVWRDNVYPGIEVDTPSHLYSYSFKAHDWPRVYASRRELLDYLEETVDDFGLRRHLRFGANVTRLVWDEAGQGYDVHLADGEVARFDVVITAVGLLGVPNYPDWPGLARFRGQRFHTSRWDDSVQLSGRRVAVVGTGSTAAQVVPAVAAVAGRLTVFQREPGWVDPKDNPEYSEAERARLGSPVGRRIERTRLYWRSEVRWIGGRIAKAHSRVEAKARRVCLDFLEAEFGQRPDLKALLTPRHPYLGKRPIHSSSYYAALRRDNVELVPHAVTAVTETGVIDATGREHDVDVLIMSTGFRPAEFLAELDVVGQHGRTIHDVWDGEPEAFLGVTVPGFPNFFMLYGPNTNFYAIVFNLEQQASYAARAIARMRRRGATSVEVRPSFVRAYNRWLRWKMRDSAWHTVNNYFTSASGRVVTQWPDGVILYWLLTRLLGRPSARYRRVRRQPGSAATGHHLSHGSLHDGSLHDGSLHEETSA